MDWTDAPPDFAICLCPAGRWYRSDRNAGKTTGFYGWQLWAAVHQVPFERVWMIEDVVSAGELAERGLGVQPPVSAESREAALLAAGKRRPKL